MAASFTLVFFPMCRFFRVVYNVERNLWVLRLFHVKRS